MKENVNGWQDLNGGKEMVKRGITLHPWSNPYLKLNLKLINTKRITTQHNTILAPQLRRRNTEQDVVANLRWWSFDVWYWWHRPPPHCSCHHRPWWLCLGSKLFFSSGNNFSFHFICSFYQDPFVDLPIIISNLV